jgi:hypothetical protein
VRPGTVIALALLLLAIFIATAIQLISIASK